MRELPTPALIVMAARCAVNVAVLSACAIGALAPPAEAQRPALRDVPAAGVARALIEQLAPLRQGMSLREWRRLHPGDAFSRYHPGAAEPTFEDWCARAEVSLQLDSAFIVQRAAYFYPPAVADPARLPPLAADSTLVDDCRLGFVWTETVARDAEHARALTTAGAARLSTAMGEELSGARVHWIGSAGWRDTHFWRRDSLTVALAWRVRTVWGSGSVDTVTSTLLIATGPASGIDLEWMSRAEAVPDLWLEQQRHGDRVLRRAILLASGPDGLTREMLSWLDRLTPEYRYSNNLTNSERDEVIDLLVRWLNAADRHDAERRAAALMAADLFLAHLRIDGVLGAEEGAAARQRLQRHGAEFVYSPLGASHVYTRSWLKQARRLAPDAPAGQLAFLVLLQLGFETGLCTDQQGLGFRAVIREGEGFLRARPHAEIATDVRLLVARAYADIVSLAHGGGSGYADTADFLAEAPAARVRAIEHYRAALPSAGDSPLRRESWLTAWRLIAGLTPTSTEFFCVYD